MKKSFLLLILLAITVTSFSQTLVGCRWRNMCDPTLAQDYTTENYVDTHFGAGTVTSFTSGNLTGLFSSSVSNSTTTPTLSFGLTSQSANLVLASPASSFGTPSFRTLVANDIPSLPWSKITSTPTTLSGYGITDGVRSVAATAGTGISISGSPITGSGTLIITNSAPDQTVTLSSGTGISVTGSYPSFTVTNSSPASTAWSLTGNAGTTPGTNFIGTTDVTGIMFKCNAGQQCGYIDLTNANTSFGLNSLTSNTTGGNCTAIGYSALHFNVSSSGNTAVGWQSLYHNTAGNNTAVGDEALTTNTSGAGNTGIGFRCLYVNTTGLNNTAIGAQALYVNTTGYYNSGIGQGALGANTTGAFNTAVGVGSLSGNVTGNFLTSIGYGGSVSSSNLSNSIGLGNNSVISASNQFVVGGGTGYLVPNWYINGVNYVMPSSQGAVGSVWTNDGSGNISWQIVNSLQSPGSAPSVSLGVGSGTGGSSSIAGTNIGGKVSITTGTSPGTGTVATITYSSLTFPTGSYPVLYPANAVTASLNSSTMVYCTGTTTTFVITSGSSALTAATTYSWNYEVTGN